MEWIHQLYFKKGEIYEFDIDTRGYPISIISKTGDYIIKKKQLSTKKIQVSEKEGDLIYYHCNTNKGMIFAFKENKKTREIVGKPVNAIIKEY